MAQSAYERVVEEIQAQLARGELRAGDRLEGERQLAERLGVSRTSVREAIRVLSVLGVISSAPGSGPSAGAQMVVRPELPLTLALRVHMTAESFRVADVVDARTMLETWAYAKAGDLTVPATVHELLDRMDATHAPDEFLTLDATLHEELVATAGNPLLDALMAALRGATQRYTTEGAAALDDWPGTRERLQAQHRLLVGHLDGGDGSAASEVAADHIAYYAGLTGMLSR